MARSKKTPKNLVAKKKKQGGQQQPAQPQQMPEMGVMEETTPARQLQLQGNHKSQLVGWERDAI